MRILSLVRVSVFRPAGGFSLVAALFFLTLFFLTLWVFFGLQARADVAPERDLQPATEQPHTPSHATVAPDFPSSVAILGATPRVIPPEAQSSPRKRLTPPAAASYLLAVPIDHRYPTRHLTCVLARVQRVDPAFLGAFLI